MLTKVQYQQEMDNFEKYYLYGAYPLFAKKHSRDVITKADVLTFLDGRAAQIENIDAFLLNNLETQFRIQKRLFFEDLDPKVGLENLNLISKSFIQAYGQEAFKYRVELLEIMEKSEAVTIKQIVSICLLDFSLSQSLDKYSNFYLAINSWLIAHNLGYVILDGNSEEFQNVLTDFVKGKIDSNEVYSRIKDNFYYKELLPFEERK